MQLSVTLVLSALALAGCGSGDRGGPPVDRGVAAKLAQAADAVGAASNPCLARERALTLQSRTIAAINANRIPTAYLEPLQSRVNEIVGELQVRCLPRPAPQSTAQSTAPSIEQPAAPAVTPKPHGRSHGKPDKHGHDHGHGKGDHGD